jgi:hypothetical protein
MSSSAEREWMTTGEASPPRRLDVALEAARLGRVVALVVVIETGFADGDAARVVAEPDQVRGSDLGLFVRVMRMGPHRAPDVVVRLGDRRDLVEPPHPGRNRHHAADAGSRGAGQHSGAILGQLGEIEMAMAVDKHQASAAAASGST